MIGLLQRVLDASVVVAGEVIGRIDQGLLVLVCAERGDDQASARRLLEKLLAIRVFADAAGKMNRNLREISGGLLLVPQFTLAADTRGGNRPSFSAAAEPALARELFEELVRAAAREHSTVATGRFGADMKVSLTNDGPVTIWLRVDPPAGPRANPPLATGGTSSS